MILLGGYIVSSHLVRIAYEQPATRERWIIPRLALKGRKPRHFRVLSGRSLYQSNFALISCDDQVPAREYYLAITVAPIFPFTLAGVHIQTTQNSLVEAVDVTVMKN